MSPICLTALRLEGHCGGKKYEMGEEIKGQPFCFLLQMFGIPLRNFKKETLKCFANAKFFF